MALVIVVVVVVVVDERRNLPPYRQDGRRPVYAPSWLLDPVPQDFIGADDNDPVSFMVRVGVTVLLLYHQSFPTVYTIFNLLDFRVYTFLT